MGRVFQSPLVGATFVVSLWTLGAGWVLWLWLSDPTPGLAHRAIWVSAVLAILWWFMAATTMLEMHPDQWLRAGWGRELVQWEWTAGCLMFGVHVAAAFHIGHDWSHTAASEHTERTAGVGEGLFVNYAFGLVWAADAAWLAGWPDSYVRRPRWVGWAVHGFLAFITFNATVVYGTSFGRMFGLLVFGGLALQSAWTRYRRRPSKTPPDLPEQFPPGTP